MLSPEIFQFFARMIEGEIGIRYSESNAYQLESRLQEICQYGGFSSIEALHQRAIKGLELPLKQMLLDVATNNETSFFRDRDLFETIQKVILPERAKQAGGSLNLRIWSAASSYGQEAVTLSLILQELRLSGYKIDGKISASDISEKVLKRAVTGEFTQLEVQRGLPITYLTKYFRTSGEMWKVNPEILSRIHFYQQNLLSPFTNSGPFDFIFCRNVLIYQSVENKIEIVAKLLKVLKDDGFLFLGAGESLMGISQEFAVSTLNGCVCYQKKRGGIKVA